MKKTITLVLIFISIMLTFNSLSALPQAPLDMDNNYADWIEGAGGAATCFADEGGVDESNLSRVDITEYCLHIDPDTSGGLYLLMAMDDTEPKDADVRVVLDVDGNQKPDYAINDSLTSHPNDGLSVAGVSITDCEDGVCTLDHKDLICGGKSGVTCTNTAEGFNNNWPSKFTSSDCDGVDCATLDGFIEIFVPWEWLGGMPPDSYLFGLYLSSHSGGTEDTSSDTTGQGVSCNDSGCYISGPTAVTLQSFSVLSNHNIDTGYGIVFAVMILLGGLSFLVWRFKLRNA